MANKKFIYGIAAVKFNQKLIGYIEKGSWDWGGTKPESTDIEAEQVPDAPVLTLLNKNATIAPTFNLIQLDYENIQAVLGGTLVGSTGSYTGWKAPTDLVELRGPWEIQFVSGQTMKIPDGTLYGYTWYKHNADGTPDEDWGTEGQKTGKSIEVPAADVQQKATFVVDVSKA